MRLIGRTFFEGRATDTTYILETSHVYRPTSLNTRRDRTGGRHIRLGDLVLWRETLLHRLARRVGRCDRGRNTFVGEAQGTVANGPRR